MDLARSIQDITEEVMLKMTAFAHRETGMRDLCLAGGVALNCVGNGRILREGPFDQIWIQPAAGDAGGALGVALSLWHRHLGKPRVSPEAAGHVGAAARRCRRRRVPQYADGMSGSYLGPRFSEAEIQRVARRAAATRRARVDRAGARRARSPRCWPTRRSSACCRAGWSSGRARSAADRSSAMRARRRCSR